LVLENVNQRCPEKLTQKAKQKAIIFAIKGWLKKSSTRIRTTKKWTAAAVQPTITNRMGWGIL
jgi:hypothetical protein